MPEIEDIEKFYDVENHWDYLEDIWQQLAKKWFKSRTGPEH